MNHQYPRSRPSRQQVPIWFLLVVMTLMSVTAMSFLYLGTRLASGSNLPSEELKILSRAYERIDSHYIHDLSKERRAELMHAAVSGMVGELDEYSLYYPPKKSEAYNVNTLGIMIGIGVVVQTVDDQVMLLYPMPDGPAERAGLKVGDILTAVDGKSVKTSRDATKIIRGKAKTEVELTIVRGTEGTRTLRVNREPVAIPSLKWARVLDADLGIGYVYLSRFTKGSAQELDLALQHMEVELGRRLRGLVFDLRQNPGGLLGTCLEITNRFLNKGTIVTLSRRNNEDIVHRADPSKCTRPDLSLVLILDKDSASASEVFAGAMQDHGRAKLVGTKSYGKGVVQSVFSWADRKERVKITTSYYLTPGGRNIENRLRPEGERGKGGLFPDREVEFVNRVDHQSVILRLGRREVPRKYRDEVAVLDEAHKAIRIYRPRGPDKDVQLGAALDEVQKLVRDKGKNP